MQHQLARKAPAAPHAGATVPVCPQGRRSVLLALAAALAAAPPPQPCDAAAAAAEAPEPACAACVGYSEGTLAACGPALCVSTYDDRPEHFVAPWEFEGLPQAALRRLVSVLQEAGATVELQTGDYVYSRLEGAGGALDLEFVFASDDNTVALRASQQQPPASSRGSSTQQQGGAVAWLSQAISSSNRVSPSQALEDLRMRLGWTVVPVLRNRQRLLIFGESPWDSFGPEPPPVPNYATDLNELL